MKKYIISPIPSKGMEEMGLGVEVTIKKLDNHEESKKLATGIDSLLRTLKSGLPFGVNISVKEYGVIKNENL